MNHELLETDVMYITRRMPREVKDILKLNDVYLAGGFIRACIAGEPPSDIDLLGQTATKMESLAHHLNEMMSGTGVHETDNAFTVRNARIPVQFIHRWTYGPDESDRLLNEFDFTIAKACIWWDKLDHVWRSRCDELFYPDLAAKRLRYTFPHRQEDVGGSLLRAFKFTARGYHASPECIGEAKMGSNFLLVATTLIIGILVKNRETLDGQ